MGGRAASQREEFVILRQSVEDNAKATDKRFDNIEEALIRQAESLKRIEEKMPCEAHTFKIQNLTERVEAGETELEEHRKELAILPLKILGIAVSTTMVILGAIWTAANFLTGGGK